MIHIEAAGVDVTRPAITTCGSRPISLASWRSRLITEPLPTPDGPVSTTSRPGDDALMSLRAVCERS